MTNLTHDEVILFKHLQGFFGFDNVIPHMRCLAIFESAKVSLPEVLDSNKEAMMERHRCLFTVVDNDDKPKVIFELSESDAVTIDLLHMNDKSIAEDLFQKVGIKHIAVSRQEIKEIGLPGSGYSMVDYLRDKLELE